MAIVISNFVINLISRRYLHADITRIFISHSHTLCTQFRFRFDVLENYFPRFKQSGLQIRARVVSQRPRRTAPRSRTLHCSSIKHNAATRRLFHRDNKQRETIGTLLLHEQSKQSSTNRHKPGSEPNLYLSRNSLVCERTLAWLESHMCVPLEDRVRCAKFFSFFPFFCAGLNLNFIINQYLHTTDSLVFSFFTHTLCKVFEIRYLPQKLFSSCDRFLTSVAEGTGLSRLGYFGEFSRESKRNRDWRGENGSGTLSTKKKEEREINIQRNRKRECIRKGISGARVFILWRQWRGRQEEPKIK